MFMRCPLSTVQGYREFRGYSDGNALELVQQKFSFTSIQKQQVSKTLNTIENRFQEDIRNIRIPVLKLKGIVDSEFFLTLRSGFIRESLRYSPQLIAQDTTCYFWFMNGLENYIESMRAFLVVAWQLVHDTQDIETEKLTQFREAIHRYGTSIQHFFQECEVLSLMINLAFSNDVGEKITDDFSANDLLVPVGRQQSAYVQSCAPKVPPEYTCYWNNQTLDRVMQRALPQDILMLYCYHDYMNNYLEPLGLEKFLTLNDKTLARMGQNVERLRDEKKTVAQKAMQQLQQTIQKTCCGRCLSLCCCQCSACCLCECTRLGEILLVGGGAGLTIALGFWDRLFPQAESLETLLNVPFQEALFIPYWAMVVPNILLKIKRSLGDIFCCSGKCFSGFSKLVLSSIFGSSAGYIAYSFSEEYTGLNVGLMVTWLSYMLSEYRINSDHKTHSRTEEPESWSPHHQDVMSIARGYENLDPPFHVRQMVRTLTCLRQFMGLLKTQQRAEESLFKYILRLMWQSPLWTSGPYQRFYRSMEWAIYDYHQGQFSFLYQEEKQHMDISPICQFARTVKRKENALIHDVLEMLLSAGSPLKIQSSVEVLTARKSKSFFKTTLQAIDEEDENESKKIQESLFEHYGVR